ncbi:MAG: hypothetical protein ACI4UX_04010 [Clostridia bacterium]
MDLHGIGYSNIRLPNDQKSYIYTYDSRINTFPEEVFVHEFLHSLERILMEYGYDIPQLHDNEKYGYKEQRLVGLKQWYNDYMTCNITNSNGSKTGLDPIVYNLKPSHESNFKYAVELDFSKEPQNIIEEIKGLLENIFNMFGKKQAIEQN